MKVYSFKTKNGYFNQVTAKSTFSAWQHASLISGIKETKIIEFKEI